MSEQQFTHFYDRVVNAWQRCGSLLCVGLDPDAARLPISGDAAIYEFTRAIVDATAPHCSAFKPQFAYYAAAAAEDQLQRLMDYIKGNYPDHLLILDSKRGDIGATANMYAKESFQRYGADAVTVNPYMGGDTIAPYLDYHDKGTVVLCRTSNPGSGELQSLVVDGQSIAHRVAQLAAEQWNLRGQLALVVGATYPEEIAQIRQIVGDMPLLIPGIGAQGGELQAVLEKGLTAAGLGLFINASRSINYASNGADFAQAAGTAAAQLNNEINELRNKINA